jgi:type I restriction enzyme, S subunit
VSALTQPELATLRLKLLTNKVGSGKTPKGSREIYSSEGVVFLRSQNVHEDGLRLDDVVFIDEEIDEEMQQTRVRPGDVLLNITGASIGRTCIVPTPFPRANVNQHVYILRLRGFADPSFVSYSL